MRVFKAIINFFKFKIRKNIFSVLFFLVFIFQYEAWINKDVGSDFRYYLIFFQLLTFILLTYYNTSIISLIFLIILPYITYNTMTFLEPGFLKIYSYMMIFLYSYLYILIIFSLIKKSKSQKRNDFFKTATILVILMIIFSGTTVANKIEEKKMRLSYFKEDFGEYEYEYLVYHSDFWDTEEEFKELYTSYSQNSFVDKDKYLNMLLKLEAEYLGLSNKLNLEITNMDEYTYGSYDAEEKTVYFNVDYIDEGINQVSETILHEAFHAYQHELFQLKEINTLNKDLLIVRQAYQWSTEEENYLTNVYKGHYSEQALETDARDFAEQANKQLEIYMNE